MNNEIEQYLFDRIEKEDYRGYHLSQHNRLPFNKISIILKLIYKEIKDYKLKIPCGDWKGIKEKECMGYYNLVDFISKQLGFITYNSLKKNIFPDLDKMGFIDRFDKKNEIVITEKRSQIWFFKLTEKAIDFVNESNELEKYKIYLSAIEIIMSKITEEVYFILKKTDKLEIHEYTFFVSDDHLNKETKINFIKKYRKLKKLGQTKFIKKIKNRFKEITLTAIDKSGKKDFMNWFNESLQIFGLLGQLPYFKLINRINISLSTSQLSLNYESFRSQYEKKLYFNYHHLSPRPNFHLHHIVPMEFSTCNEEREVIDNYKNLIYLNKETHNSIPHRNNLLIELVYSNGKLFLKEIEGKQKIELKEFLLDKNNIKEILEYNKKVINLIK